MISHRKPHVNVVTIGQAGHGKTTLTAAISSTLGRRFGSIITTYDELDNPRKENIHGITTSTAHVEYETATRHYSQVDCCSHTDYYKKILGNPVRIEVAILVVAATDGPTGQTRDQIRLAQQVGVSDTVVFLNKCDMINDDELLELVEDEVRELLNMYGFLRNYPQIVKGSAFKALRALEGDRDELGERAIIQLMDVLDTHISAPVQAISRPFLIPTKDAFTISGRGTFVTGRVERGIIRPSDPISIVGIDKYLHTSCVGLERSRKLVNEARVGETVNVVLRAIEIKDLNRGDVLAVPGTIRLCANFKAEVYMLRGDEGGRHTPFINYHSQQFHFHGADVNGSISLSEGREQVMPGDNLSIEVKLIAPIGMEAGLHFGIRENGKAVGAGVVTSILS